ncbi:MAG TPA: CsgG/HfaB family protein [Gemmatimonadaceae bacterium]|nr:CsgG/HfaB family protein [Gemmatimonadaceae bacterium]
MSPARATADSAARKAIANEQRINVASIPSNTIGVAPLAADSSDPIAGPLAYALPDLLMADLAQSHQVVVVDRIRLDAMLRELHMVSSGRVDQTTAPRVGRLLQARRLLIGRLVSADAGKQINVDMRIADVASSSVAPAVQSRATSADILAAEKELAFRVLEAMGVTLTPAERTAIEQRPTKRVSALLAYGRGVRDEAAGEYGAAAQQYAQAVRIDPSFSRARVRLQAVQALGGDQESLSRASFTAADGLNPSLTDPSDVNHIGGAADPSFPQPVTVILTITNVP